MYYYFVFQFQDWEPCHLSDLSTRRASKFLFNMNMNIFIISSKLKLLRREFLRI